MDFRNAIFEILNGKQKELILLNEKAKLLKLEITCLEKIFQEKIEVLTENEIKEIKLLILDIIKNILQRPEDS